MSIWENGNVKTIILKLGYEVFIEDMMNLFGDLKGFISKNYSIILKYITGDYKSAMIWFLIKNQKGKGRQCKFILRL